MRLPPNVGRVAARIFFSLSMASSVQSAVRPVRTRVATALARSRPIVVAPTRKISGPYFLTALAIPNEYGPFR